MTSKNYTYTYTYGTASSGEVLPFRSVQWNSTGSNTPYGKLRRGLFNENPYGVNAQWDESEQSAYRLSIGGTLKYGAVSKFSPTPVFDSVPTPLFAEAVSKLLENWRNSRFNAGVTIGEGRESVQMIAKNLARISKAANALRHGDFGSVKRQLSQISRGDLRSARRIVEQAPKQIADAWLELQFGWKPLIADVYDLAEAVSLQPRTGRVRSTKRNTGGGRAACANFLPSECQIHHNERRLHLMVIVRSQATFVERFGLSDPKSIAWNLTGGSFLADWVFPIGAHLDMLHASTHMPVDKCVTTNVTRQSATVYASKGKVYCGWLCEQSARRKRTIFSMQRTVSATIPQAWALQAQVPREVTPLWDPDLRKLSLVAALAVQRLRF